MQQTQTLILASGLLWGVFAADPEIVATSKHHRSVALLNRHTFEGNVIKGGHVEHWVVLFCADWYAPCAAELQRSFKVFAEHHDYDLNRGMLLRDFVRFATVDCAVDKVLCNTQDVSEYPTVTHYHGGQSKKSWTGNGKMYESKRVARWLHTLLVDARAQMAEVPPPLLSDAERAMLLRLAASAAALVAFAVWSIGRGTELWLAASTLGVQRHAERGPKQADSPGTPRNPLALCLPREWGQRGSTEL